MRFSTLQLTLLAAIVAWAQLCCCQAAAVMRIGGAAVGPHASETAQASACCGGCTATTASPAIDLDNENPGLPCHDHGDCAGCFPRPGWMPEGPSELAPDLLGTPLPGADFASLPILIEQHHPGFGAPPGRCGFLEPPSLVRLHCALII